MLGVSLATVQRHWTYARAWLYREIQLVFQTSTGRTLHTLPIDPASSRFRARFAGENRVVVESHSAIRTPSPFLLALSTEE